MEVQQSITRAEIYRQISFDSQLYSRARDLVLDYQEALEIANRFRDTKALILTTGAFDLLHIGHTRYMEDLVLDGHRRAALLNRIPLIMVGINSDESVKRNKGARTNGRPVMPQSHRAELVAALKGIDFTFIFDHDGQLCDLRPHVLQVFEGSDNKPEDRPEVKFLRDQGTQISLIPVEDERPGSTTGILDRIHQENIR